MPDETEIFPECKRVIGLPPHNYAATRLIKTDSGDIVNVAIGVQKKAVFEKNYRLTNYRLSRTARSPRSENLL